MGTPPPDGDEVWCQKMVNGKPVKDGHFTIYRPDGGMMIDGYYRDGKQDGQWRMWYESGVIHSIDTFKNGVLDGPHTSWYPNGHFNARGQYRNGQKEGTWKRWDDEGFRNWDEVYKNGKRIS